MSNIFERAGDKSSTNQEVRNANDIPAEVKDKDIDSYMFAKMEKENRLFYISEGMTEKEANEKARLQRRNAERNAKEAEAHYKDLKRFL